MPVTVIVPGDTPGLSVPATAMLPITEPAAPKVAPERTVICAARTVDPDNRQTNDLTSRLPEMSTQPSEAVPAIVTYPLVMPNASTLAIVENATGAAVLPPDTRIVSVPAPPSTDPGRKSSRHC
ncbi:hypothetical protein EV283_3778 [Sphingomonas sp. BK036]|nr:hypothetical protein EV283_3778 [Sphingomonas sp. BK036]